MATFGSSLRRGLPRVPGGEPWPAADAAPGTNSNGVADADAPFVDAALPATTDASALSAAFPETASAPRTVRRGLPRVAGGEPWPSASVALAPAPVERASDERGETPRTGEQPEAREVSRAAPRVGTAETAAAGSHGASELRRGLPRELGGEPWPPAGPAPAVAAATVTDPVVGAPHVTAAEVASTATVPEGAPPTGVPLSQPLPFRRTVWAGASAAVRPAPRPEPTRIGPFTRGQWAGALIVGGAGLLFAAGMAVLAVRWLLSTQWGVDFLATYPGEYHLPEGAPVGFPAWLGWQHFFNVFLMVLIIRTGLTVRTEKRPTVFWSPRSNGNRKISLNLWFHQSLDILWLVNGIAFVVLLFVTGQWLRIVPTSWEVFPNALSAGLQYVSLDWPTENGWVNYNSLQQLAYFTTVFLAAPLAAVTGVRMSGVWPKNATGLNKAYPVEWARAVHFPVMLYFVVFIAVHVFLVFATGALRNLNHMYAAQGSADPNAYADNWTGFWFFVASLVVIVAAWVAARPLVLAPIARLFGSVSRR